MNAMKAELNMIVLPSQKWHYFDSTLYAIPYEPQPTMQFAYSGPFGRGMGLEQTDFDDLELFKQYGNPSKILVRSGSKKIDAIQFTYGGVDGPLHGGNSGRVDEFVLEGDTKITKVIVRTGDALDAITFFTDSGKQYSFGAGKGGIVTEIEAPVEGAYLAAIQGKEGSNSIEAITFVWMYLD